MNSTPNLDDQSVIVALTNGVGAHLGKRARSSFFELARRLPRVRAFTDLDMDAKQQIVDILALSAFYSTVVFPLESGTAFLAVAEKAGASHVRIGKDRLTAQFGAKMRLCISNFHSMLQTAQVPLALLSFATLADFVRSVITVAQERENEDLDRQNDSGAPSGRVR